MALRLGALLAAATSVARAAESSGGGGSPNGPDALVGSYLEGKVTSMYTDVVEGYTTFRLSVVPNSRPRSNCATFRATSTTRAHASAVWWTTHCDSVKADSIYALFGDGESELTVPPAYHVAAPFGVDIGTQRPPANPICRHLLAPAPNTLTCERQAARIRRSGRSTPNRSTTPGSRSA